MNQVAVFTLNGCRFCQDLKDGLTAEGIHFHDIEISKNRELWEQVLSQTEDDALPTVFIQTDKEGNGLIYTPGRDFYEIDDIIETIKKNI